MGKKYHNLANQYSIIIYIVEFIHKLDIYSLKRYNYKRKNRFPAIIQVHLLSNFYTNDKGFIQFISVHEGEITWLSEYLVYSQYGLFEYNYQEN